MVLAERHNDIMRNGRSRASSPNGHNNGGGGGGGLSPETSSDDENSIKRNGKSKAKSEYEEKIRVGRDYQAVCPELIPAIERKPELLNDRALLVWSPTKDIPDARLEEYITVAKEKYGYNGEQALGMLFWHKHDLERAVMDLANFTPFPDEWSVEDKVLFEQAFQFHGKSFHRIRQMLPDKSIASLVKYYYSWKKTRHRQSVMDRQEKAKASKDGSDNGSENGSNEESDNNEDKDQSMATSDSKIPISGGNNGNNSSNNSGGNIAIGGTTSGNSETNRQTNNSNKKNIQQDLNSSQSNETNSGNNTTSTNVTVTTPGTGTATSNNSNGSCTGCGVLCNTLYSIGSSLNNGKLCNSCHHHWRRTGTKRPTSGPFGKRYRDRNTERHKRKPPRGMHINHDDLVALASDDFNISNYYQIQLTSLLSQVQINKQNISSLKRKISECSEDLRPIDTSNRLNSRWTNEELLMAVQGVRKYGKDFQSIADTIGTKTEAHIRTFFVNYRRRYNLDNVLKEYEADQQKEESSDSINKDVSQKNMDLVELESEGKVSDSNSISNANNNSVNNLQKTKDAENVIMEIDLDSETSQPSPPKKLSNNTTNLNTDSKVQ